MRLLHISKEKMLEWESLGVPSGMGRCDQCGKQQPLDGREHEHETFQVGSQFWYSWKFSAYQGGPYLTSVLCSECNENPINPLTGEKLEDMPIAWPRTGLTLQACVKNAEGHRFRRSSWSRKDSYLKVINGSFKSAGCDTLWTAYPSDIVADDWELHRDEKG